SDLDGIAFDSPSDGWVAGYVAVGETTKPFTAHWDGASWRTVPVPFKGDEVLLNDVVAISATDAWAVGVGTLGEALTYHWDGAVWTSVANPSGGQLFGVTSSASTDVWAVGVSGYPYQGLALHWNGSA